MVSSTRWSNAARHRHGTLTSKLASSRWKHCVSTEINLWQPFLNFTPNRGNLEVVGGRSEVGSLLSVGPVAIHLSHIHSPAKSSCGARKKRRSIFYL